MTLPDILKFESTEDFTREIMFRNFAGKASQYNDEGNRNFCLKLTPREAELMIADGWNVKFRKQTDPDDIPDPYLPISLSAKFRPSRVVLITARNGGLGRTTLTEDMYMFVDWVDIAYVDLTIRPYEWEGKKP